ncbi:g2312 [Coccomyxa viridis]|uniref:G2312 protein n=1 Tax=Coccomyxa viridis TaxID=1274662 RepID=A0ABP1FK30_9CHLO
MYRGTAVLALLALCAAAGVMARDMKAQAPGPAGAERKPVADLVFILSANMATFTTTNTLVLNNASSTAQFYGKGARAGVIPTNRFVNDTAGAKYVSSNGQWLSNPTATLYGYDQNGTDHSILLTLASPTADMSEESVTFNVTVITNGETSIKTRKGVANNVVEESITETDLLLTNVQAGTMLTDVALFVDSDSQALGEQAQTKYWRRGGWGGGWGGYNRGWGGGYNRGWGWGWGK